MSNVEAMLNQPRSADEVDLSETCGVLADFISRLGGGAVMSLVLDRCLYENRQQACIDSLKEENERLSCENESLREQLGGEGA